MMERMSLLGFGVCAPDAALRASLPFPACEILREAMPPLLRRRASEATRMAFSAAGLACQQAYRLPSDLPTVFASVGGEIQTTDQLCVELAKHDGGISPSAFHNSVQNTAAGYWSIAHGCTQAATALAAGHDSFAMALLEAWCQLSCHGGEVLLVCYEERWPAHLAPAMGEPAFACAMVLAAGVVSGSLAQLGRPYLGTEAFPSEWATLAGQMPALAAVPLLGWAAAGGTAQDIPVSTASPAWQTKLYPYNPQPS